jgi:hypothetical protein
MNTFKTLALRIAAITAAFALAFTFMVSSSNEADAATTTMTAGVGIDDVMISTSVPLSKAIAAVGANGMTAVTAGQTLQLTLPVGTVINESNVAATDFDAIQAANGGTIGNLTACSAVAASKANRTITCTIVAASLSTSTNAGTGAITIATTATGGGNEIIMPLVATTTGSLAAVIAAGATDTVTALANLTIVAPTIALSVTSVKADGVSSANVTFGSSADVTTGSDTLTVITDFGTFFKGDDATANFDIMKSATQWSPDPSVSAGQTSYVELVATTDATDPASLKMSTLTIVNG